MLFCMLRFWLFNFIDIKWTEKSNFFNFPMMIAREAKQDKVPQIPQTIKKG